MGWGQVDIYSLGRDKRILGLGLLSLKNKVTEGERRLDFEGQTWTSPPGHMYHTKICKGPAPPMPADVAFEVYLSGTNDFHLTIMVIWT